VTARLDRLRKVCLALPEATEQVTWGTDLTFRVRNKIFAITGEDAGGVTVKATPDDQEALVATHPRVTVAAYVGRYGWVSVDLTGKGLDWGMVEDLVRDSYRLVAPKTLGRAVAEG
jgi:predicted DNA-binding protein (MmcQ/YjbR family)